MTKYIILTLTIFLFCSCSTIRGFKKNDSRINIPKKAEAQNRFLKSADEKPNSQKQVLSPQAFTKWTLFSSAGSFIVFQFLRWKHIV
jgi:hypothetical protein|tara:strand:- start:2038 stop:2298 length:261 start_codon:yes stop_codon:yes gene_type:complete